MSEKVVRRLFTASFTVIMIVGTYLFGMYIVRDQQAFDVSAYRSHVGQPLSSLGSAIPSGAKRVQRGDDRFPLSGYAKPRFTADFEYVMMWRSAPDVYVYVYVGKDNRILGAEAVGS